MSNFKVKGITRNKSEIIMQARGNWFGPLLLIPLLVFTIYKILSQPDIQITSIVISIICILFIVGIINLMVNRNSRIGFSLEESRLTKNGKAVCHFEEIDCISLEKYLHEDNAAETYYLEIRIIGKEGLELMSGQEIEIYEIAQEISKWTKKELYLSSRY